MLKLKRYIKRVSTLGVGDLEALAAQLPAYGAAGVYALADVLKNPHDPELARINALTVLGTQRTQLPTGEPYLMAMIETLAESAPPDIDLLCFVGVYANGLKGRAEAVALVERFKTGTDRQQSLFKSVDSIFMQGLAAREIVARFEAQHANR